MNCFLDLRLLHNTNGVLTFLPKGTPHVFSGQMSITSYTRRKSTTNFMDFLPVSFAFIRQAILNLKKYRKHSLFWPVCYKMERDLYIIIRGLANGCGINSSS